MSERKNGFTILYDDVVHKTWTEQIEKDGKIETIAGEFGLMGAAVFGVVWRHFKMRDGYCHCSTKTMAKLTGLSKRSACRWLDRLRSERMIRRIKKANPEKSEPAHYVCDYTPVVERERKDPVAESPYPVDRESIPCGRESIPCGRVATKETIQETFRIR